MSQLFISQLSRSKMGIMDIVPAKDPFIKVRLLVELGDGVVVSDQVANLTRDAILFLKRIHVDKYISQGQTEELTS
ncbi:putative GINS complex, subunit Psf1 protein [Helianthus anomalus]